jgi:2-deoxy-D-gluconate 3-dehydrogenase
MSRVALVTGAARGIGRAVAGGLADDGWDVALLGRSFESLQPVVEEVPGPALAVAADVRHPDELAAAVARIEDELGPIEALVNNAGVQRLSLARDVTESDWDDVLDTNLKGAFFCAQAVGRRMLDRKRGAVVNIASAAALIAVAERAAYASSKAGLIMLTKVLALEWAEHGVRVNAVAPTFVETEMGRLTLDQPGVREQIVGRIPMGRLADPGDVVAATKFLLDGHSAGFITGQVVAIDGGLTIT